jgi:hypothetical protein
MFRRVRITPSTAIAVLALIFAATGGAFAATGNTGNSDSGASHAQTAAVAAKAKPKAKTGPRGPAGPAGKNGAPGATGPAGPTGPVGPAGSVGATGPAGVAGVQGEKGTAGTPGQTGATGPKGEPGEPWTPNNTLPAGATLKGQFAVAQSVTGLTPLSTAVSFGIPLATAATAHYIKPGETPPTGCSGTAQAPVAEEGNLCVFAEEETDIVQTFPEVPHVEGTLTVGFILKAIAKEAGFSEINGAWAVTAE